MARRAYAVLNTGEIANVLCFDNDNYAIYSTKKQAEDRVARFVDYGYGKENYEIVKVELK